MVYGSSKPGHGYGKFENSTRLTVQNRTCSRYCSTVAPGENRNETRRVLHWKSARRAESRLSIAKAHSASPSSCVETLKPLLSRTASGRSRARSGSRSLDLTLFRSSLLCLFLLSLARSLREAAWPSGLYRWLVSSTLSSTTAVGRTRSWGFQLPRSLSFSLFCSLLLLLLSPFCSPSLQPSLVASLPLSHKHLLSLTHTHSTFLSGRAKVRHSVRQKGIANKGRSMRRRSAENCIGDTDNTGRA